MTIHPAHVFWLFGLSGAGKSTLALLLATQLRAHGVALLSLDGDVMRSGLCRGLGFSDADRAENLRRSAEVARIALASNLCVIAAFITPLEVHRQMVVEHLGADRVSLIHVDAPLATCRRRDVKGLYAGAQAGKVAQMTGMSSLFEPPNSADMVLHTEREDIETSSAHLLRFALSSLRGKIRTEASPPSFT